MMQRSFGRLVAVLATSAGCACAFAQNWPSKPVRIINGASPGGPVDVITRALAQKLQSQFGQSFIVENKPGATEIIAADVCAKSPPNGYTLCVLTQQPIANAPNLISKLPYDPGTSFTAVGMIGVPLSMIVVNSNVGVKTFAELVQYDKKNPGTLNWGSNGTGSTSHLMFEAIKADTGWKVTHVPFTTASAALQGLISNQVQIEYTPPGGAGRGYLDTGKVIPLAFGGTKRLASFPNVPTFAEVGLGRYLMQGWNAVMAPAGLPEDIVVKLNNAITSFVQSPDTQALLEIQTIGPLTATPAGTVSIIKSGTEVFNAGFKRAGIVAE